MKTVNLGIAAPKLITTIILAIAGTLCCGVSPADAESSTGERLAGETICSIRLRQPELRAVREVECYINAERSKRGLSPLATVGEAPSLARC
jgi:hypothetical protein